MLISDANTGHLLDYIDQVVTNNVVQYELSLISEIDGIEILWGGSQEVAGACSTSRLKTIVLKCDEP